MNLHRPTVEDLVALYRLEPLPGEGGLYRQTYRSPDRLPPGSPRPLCTAIVYLLTDAADSFSALHRLPGDEIYHFYLGDPLLLTLLYPDGASRTVTLGQAVLGGQQVQVTVPRGVWQGSRVAPGGQYALVGTTMAPGYQDEDYEPGQRAALLRAYPAERAAILALTRG